MSESWDRLTSHEKNMLVAEALGWHEPFIIDLADELWGHHPTKGYQAVPLFIADLNACRVVEDEIERRGLQEAYIQALDQIVIYERLRGWTWFRWGILRALPDQRCQAAVEVLEKRGNTPTAEQPKDEETP